MMPSLARTVAPLLLASLSLPATASVGGLLGNDLSLIFTDIQEFPSGPLFGRHGLAMSNVMSGGGDGWGDPLPDSHLMGGGGSIGDYDGFGPNVGDGWHWVNEYGGEMHKAGYHMDVGVCTLKLGFTNLTDGQSSYLLTAELTGMLSMSAWRGSPNDFGGFGVQATMLTYTDGHYRGYELGDWSITAPWSETAEGYQPLVFQVGVPAGPPEYGQNTGLIEVRIVYTAFYQAVPSPTGALLLLGAGAIARRRR